MLTLISTQLHGFSLPFPAGYMSNGIRPQYCYYSILLINWVVWLANHPLSVVKSPFQNLVQLNPCLVLTVSKFGEMNFATLDNNMTLIVLSHIELHFFKVTYKIGYPCLQIHSQYIQALVYVCIISIFQKFPWPMHHCYKPLPHDKNMQLLTYINYHSACNEVPQQSIMKHMYIHTHTQLSLLYEIAT